MQGRNCKIAVICVDNLPKKDQFISLIRPAGASVKSWTYDVGNKFSDKDLQDIAESDLVYFFYDADATDTAKESRQSITEVLDQISAEMIRAGKEKVCYAVATLPKLPATPGQTQIIQKGAGMIKDHGFMQLPNPVSPTSSEKLKDIVLGQVSFVMTPDESFATATSASQPIPVMAQPIAAAAVQAFAPPSVASVPAAALITVMLNQGGAELDKAIKLAEDKLQLQKHELENLKTLRSQAELVLHAHKNRAADEGSFLVATKNFGETATKILDGRADVKRIVGGAISCFFGVLLLAISIPLFFVAPPFGLAAAITSAHLITATVIGGLLTAAGAYSIYAGREQGVARESKQFIEMKNKPMLMAH